MPKNVRFDPPPPPVRQGEVEAWGEPTFRVRHKLFAIFAHASNHHGAGRHSVWIKCRPTNQQLLIASDPQRFFFPPSVGPSGWVRAWLDDAPDWETVAELLRDGYRHVAPARLKARPREPG